MFITPAYAHGGGLDSSGGHNCYVGSCQGTYHSHRSSYSNDSSSDGGAGVGVILIVVAIALWVILSR